MERRTLNDIRKDLRNYVVMWGVLNKIGDTVGAAKYLQHVKAMERELELRRTGRVLTF